MNRNDLLYTCSLIEYIGRKMKLKRADVVNGLNADAVKRIYTYADVFHSDIIDKVADEFIESAHLETGDYDNVGTCKYNVPSYWDIGEVFARLIEDVYVDGDDVAQLILKIYNSWLTDAISNYNSDLFYQPRDYIYECYLENKICA
jgi:hypothetical protein